MAAAPRVRVVAPPGLPTHVPATRQAGTASTTEKTLRVGTMRCTRNPAAAARAAHSSLVRSLACRAHIMCMSNVARWKRASFAPLGTHTSTRASVILAEPAALRMDDRILIES